MSRDEELKNKVRQRQSLTERAMPIFGDDKGGSEPAEPEAPSTNVSSDKPFNETTLEENNQDTKAVRKRVSFDIRVDLHKQLKMRALLQEKNIYSLIEDAIEKYLKEQQ